MSLSLLQAEQLQLSQPLLAGKVLLPSDDPHGVLWSSSNIQLQVSGHFTSEELFWSSFGPLRSVLWQMFWQDKGKTKSPAIRGHKCSRAATLSSSTSDLLTSDTIPTFPLVCTYRQKDSKIKYKQTNI